MVKILRFCLICNAEFYTVQGQLNAGKGKTCSRSCAAKLTPKRDCSGSKNNHWKGGSAKSPDRYLKAKRRYNERHPEKTTAHMAVRSALAKGVIRKEPCAMCGNHKVEGHHDDYSRPLDVIWLCRPCHRKTHYG